MHSLHVSNSLRHRVATALFLAVVLSVLTSLSAFAQQEPCEPGQCPGFRIWNCTENEYHVSFLLCCNGQTVQTPYAEISPTNCPDGPPSFARFFPEGCTLIGIADVNPPLPPDVEVILDLNDCRAMIRYE